MVPGFKQESSKLIGSFKRVLSMGRTPQNEAAANRKSNGTSLTTVGEEEKQSSVSIL